MKLPLPSVLRPHLALNLIKHALIAAVICAAGAQTARGALLWNQNGTAIGADPATATGGGGSANWYSGNWWNGSGNVGWDGSAAILGGSGGTLTMEAGVDSAGQLLFKANGYTVDMNGFQLNFADVNVASGVTGTIAGTGSTGKNLSSFNGGGKLVLGNGSALSAAQFGFTVFDKGGSVFINNDPTGAGAAFNTYTQFNNNTNAAAFTLGGVGRVNTAGGADFIAAGGANLTVTPGLDVSQTGTLLTSGGVTNFNNNGGSIIFELDLGGQNRGAAINGYDAFDAENGNIAFNSNGQLGTVFNINLVNGYTPNLNDTFDIFTANNILFGGSSTVDDFTINGPSGYVFSASIVDDVSDSLRLTVTAVPEPSTTALCALSVLLLVASTRSRSLFNRRVLGKCHA